MIYWCVYTEIWRNDNATSIKEQREGKTANQTAKDVQPQLNRLTEPKSERNVVENHTDKTVPDVVRNGILGYAVLWYGHTQQTMPKNMRWK